MVASVVHPAKGWRPDAPDNDRSVVIELSQGERRLLLTGDLDGAGLTELLDRPSRPIDAVLAPHHGGRSANPSWLYDWARPSLVVASQREPTLSTRDALSPLEKQGVAVLRTWRRGAIRLQWTNADIIVQGFLDKNVILNEMARQDVKAGLPRRAGLVPLAVLWPSRRVAIAALGLLLGAVACLLLAIIEWGAWAMVTPGRRHDPSRPDTEPPPWEPIETRAADGTRLAGAWRASAVAEGRTLVLLHGFAEDRASLVGRAEAMAVRGWNVAVLDSRGRGQSGGDRTSFGGREADDLIAWIDSLAQRVGPGFSLAAWGRSMGSAIALRAAASDPRVRALVLEAPYPDLTPTVAAWLRRLRLPGVFAGGILRRAGRLAGVSLTRPRPIDLAPRVEVPVLVLHGTNDRISPLADARRLAVAFPRPAPVIDIEGARHSDVFDVGGDVLADRIAAFLDEAIQELTAQMGRAEPLA